MLYMSESVSFFSSELASAQSVQITLAAPVNHEGVFQVGLPSEVAKTAPRIDLQIIGSENSVTVRRDDGMPIQAEWINTDDIAQTEVRLPILKDNVEEVVFERGGIKKVPGRGFMREWFTKAATDDELAASFAQAIGTTCMKKLS